jgi:hypothetical protein
VPQYALPSRLKIIYNNAVHYSALKELGIEAVYQDIFEEIARELPKDVPFPDDKLFFATPLYDFGEGFVQAKLAMAL